MLLQKRIGIRALSAFLSLWVLFATVSCTTGGRTVGDDSSLSATEDQRLIVEEPSFSLTEQEQTEMSDRLTSLGTAIVRSAEGAVLNEEQQSRLREYCRTSVLPILSENRVTALECRQFCDAVEEFSAELSSENSQSGVSLSLFRALWQNGVSVLGSRRFGSIAYASLLLFADENIRKNAERYEKYGYEWYRDDAESARISRESFATEVGAEDFETICQIAYFSLSLTEQLPESDDALFNDAELIRLLQKQTSDLAAQGITARQWELTVQLFCKVIPESYLLPSSLTSVQKNEGRALLSADYPSALARSVPALVTLISAMTAQLTENDLAALRRDDADARTVLFCRLAACCESELRVAIAALEENGMTALKQEKEAVQSAASYETFCNEIQSAEAEDVIEAIRACAAEKTAGSVSALRQTWIGFSWKSAPYLTFAIFGEGQS